MIIRFYGKIVKHKTNTDRRARICFCMEYVEIGCCFVIGLTVMLLIAYLTRVKKRGVRLLVVNSLIGGGIIALVSLSRLLYMPFSPLTMLITGMGGVPGAVMIIIFTLFLT